MAAFVNSLSYLFDLEKIPDSLEIVLENQSRVCITALGISLGNINLSKFMESIPPFQITMNIQSKNCGAIIVISENAIKEIEEFNIPNESNKDTLKILCDTNETYDKIKKVISDFKTNNPLGIKKITIFDNTTLKVSMTQDESISDEIWNNIAESLSGIINKSDREFRKSCYSTFKNRDHTLPIRALIFNKLQEIDRNEKNSKK